MPRTRTQRMSAHSHAMLTEAARRSLRRAQDSDSGFVEKQFRREAVESRGSNKEPKDTFTDEVENFNRDWRVEIEKIQAELHEREQVIRGKFRVYAQMNQVQLPVNDETAVYAREILQSAKKNKLGAIKLKQDLSVCIHEQRELYLGDTKLAADALSALKSNALDSLRKRDQMVKEKRVLRGTREFLRSIDNLI
ncbi:hypothetical protein NEOLI_004903 [Neolecta irregularis DAH-3]|uniref:Uncharacterized protein n=1 Tax=Neolecta irregularis (strain DAH-3) TaxID=1198029 RepID=A0A1U7LJL0_NEOID|nr:hypothetical protein NEOLI_004903 [Neolecta irregularis DAH-3]|eukprot:OLL22834.1 hypothetical protein NEOLI_004903 [Neolecta irregularis DAH-3]